MITDPADLLRQRGIQVTAQRLAVLRAVSGHPNITDDAVAEVVRAEICAISLLSVYDALSVLIPVLEDILGYNRNQIRALFERHGVLIQEWDRVRTDWLTIREGAGSILTPVSPASVIVPQPAW